VRPTRRPRRAAGVAAVVALAALLAAVALLRRVSDTLPPLARTWPPQQPASPAPAAHQIAVRNVDGVATLVERATGRPFVTRGANYVRLAEQRKPSGQMVLYHATFNVGTYDRRRTEAVLRRMHADGYNTVRLFIDGLCATACAGDPAGGISRAYAANVADCLRRAKAAGLLAILTTDYVPATEGYAASLGAGAGPDFAGNNINYLTTAGVRVNAEFWRDLIIALRAESAPLDDVLTYEVRNELRFDAASAPLTLTTGLVRTATGRSYDMASRSDGARMLDDGVVFWLSRVRAAIRSVDPTALVAVGLPQPPAQPVRGLDPVRYRAVIERSNVDLVDLHFYPGQGIGLAAYARAAGFAAGPPRPLLLGELGVTTAVAVSAPAALATLRANVLDSCRYGIRGWLLWTWDTTEQPGFWNARSDGGVIERGLSPARLAESCANQAAALR